MEKRAVFSRISFGDTQEKLIAVVPRCVSSFSLFWVVFGLFVAASVPVVAQAQTRAYLGSGPETQRSVDDCLIINEKPDFVEFVNRCPQQQLQVSYCGIRTRSDGYRFDQAFPGTSFRTRKGWTVLRPSNPGEPNRIIVFFRSNFLHPNTEYRYSYSACQFRYESPQQCAVECPPDPAESATESARGESDRLNAPKMMDEVSEYAPSTLPESTKRLITATLNRSQSELSESTAENRNQISQQLQAVLPSGGSGNEQAFGVFLNMMGAVALGYAQGQAMARGGAFQPPVVPSAAFGNSAGSTSAQACQQIAQQSQSRINSLNVSNPCDRLRQILAITQDTLSRARSVCPQYVASLEQSVRDQTNYVNDRNGVCR